MTFYDYQKAFSRQCHRRGVLSFIRNGVRPSLIPVLVNYFQGRKCQIKWRGHLSRRRLLPGSGAQGSMLGNWEYLSQTNNNVDHIPPDDRWKWVDDLTSLEVVDLINIGLSSYNFRRHVASDMNVNGHYVSQENLKTQKFISTLDSWSDKQQMKLHEKKTKIMLINFTKNYQFSTRITLKNSNVEQISEMKILGTILSDKLTWDSNCSNIIRKCYMRMQLLRKVASFGTDPEVLKIIYIQIIRVILEQSCVVWDGALTTRNRRSLEKCQKLCLKIILPNISYTEALKKLKIEDLQTRRTKLTLKFGQINRAEGKLSKLFKQNPKIHNMNTRFSQAYTTMANTKRYKNSPILNMQKLINQLDK